MRQFVSEYMLDFSGNPKTRFALEMHQITEAVALGFRDAGKTVELTFEDDALVGAKFLGDVDQFHPDTIDGIANLAHRSSLTPLKGPARAPLVLNETLEGTTRIGGKAPATLVLPEADFASGYQFIGELDLSHIYGAAVVPLIYPLFLDYAPPLFLDVSDPELPVVLPQHKGRMFNLDKPHRPFATDAIPYGPLQEAPEIAAFFKGGGAVTFREISGQFELSDPSLADGMVTAGVPDWLQPPQIPICPKTGSPMQFDAEIGGGLPAISHDLDVPEGSVYAECFKEMTFGDGVLFVFANPLADTICLFSQAT